MCELAEPGDDAAFCGTGAEVPSSNAGPGVGQIEFTGTPRQGRKAGRPGGRCAARGASHRDQGQRLDRGNDRRPGDLRSYARARDVPRSPVQCRRPRASRRRADRRYARHPDEAQRPARSRLAGRRSSTWGGCRSSGPAAAHSGSAEPGSHRQREPIPPRLEREYRSAILASICWVTAHQPPRLARRSPKRWWDSPTGRSRVPRSATAVAKIHRPLTSPLPTPAPAPT